MNTQQKKPIRVLMVCLGNICRSPLAEGILRDMAQKEGLNCVVESAGISGWYCGEPPHPLSQKVALQNKIDLSKKRGRQFVAEDFLHFDRIFFMDADNMSDAQRKAGSYWQKAKASLLLDALPGHPFNDVPDPYYGEFDGFIDVFELIKTACHNIVEELKQFEQAD